MQQQVAEAAKAFAGRQAPAADQARTAAHASAHAASAGHTAPRTAAHAQQQKQQQQQQQQAELEYDDAEILSPKILTYLTVIAATAVYGAADSSAGGKPLPPAVNPRVLAASRQFLSALLPPGDTAAAAGGAGAAEAAEALCSLPNRPHGLAGHAGAAAGSRRGAAQQMQHGDAGEEGWQEGRGAAEQQRPHLGGSSRRKRGRPSHAAVEAAAAAARERCHLGEWY
jgi:hypothetical protein